MSPTVLSKAYDCICQLDLCSGFFQMSGSDGSSKSNRGVGGSTALVTSCRGSGPESWVIWLLRPPFCRWDIFICQNKRKIMSSLPDLALLHTGSRDLIIDSCR